MRYLSFCSLSLPCLSIMRWISGPAHGFARLSVMLAFLVVLGGCASLPSAQIWSHFDETTVRADAGWNAAPFRFGSMHPIVPVEINGKSYRFLFDTGAPSTISERVAAELGVSAVGHFNLIDSQGTTQARPFGVVPSLSMGGARFNDVGVFIANLAPKDTSFACLKLDGIIGYTMMPKMRSWIIDYDSQKIRFGNEPIVFANAYRIPFSYQRGQGPILSVNIPGHSQPVPIVLDTGSDGGFSYPSEVLSDLQRRGLTRGPIIAFKSRMQTGLFKTSRTIRVARYAQIQNFSLGNLPVRSAVFSFQTGLPLLGNDFLRHFRVGIDWDKQVVYMEPKSGAAKHLHLAPTYAIHGVSISPVGRKFVITGKAEHSSDALSELKIGDEVVRMNGVDITTKVRRRFCSNVLSKDQDVEISPMSLTLRRSGQLRQVKLPVIAPYR